MPTKVVIPENVKSIIQDAVIDGNQLRLRGSLDHQVYLEVNKVLEALGGKWKSGKTKAHVFPDGIDISALIEEVTDTSHIIKNAYDFFATSPQIAREMAVLAGIEHLTDGDFVFDPNAGEGALLDAAREMAIAPNIKFEGIEIDHSRVDRCQRKGLHVRQGDFLLQPVEPKYQLMLMNPPFNSEGVKNVFVEHIRHALAMLTHAGVLASIAPASLGFSEIKKITSLRVDATEILPVSGSAFKDSGTNVKTVIALFKSKF